MAVSDENFDNIGAPGGDDLGPVGQPRLINGWTFTLLDAAGNQSGDENSVVDVTKDVSQSSLTANDTDGVARINGPQAFAAVIKATGGEEFRFVSFKVESGLVGAPPNHPSVRGDYRLVGYRDGAAVDGATYNFTAPSMVVSSP